MENRTPTAVRWLVKWVLSIGKATESHAPVLLPLTPEYDPDKHRVYFDAIETALSDPKREVRNIALTGSYGVGKSSILAQVAKRHRRGVIAVSLSTLGFPDDEPVPTGDTARSASTKTNRIQKEIVKQLLYSQDPLKTPGSRYRRTTRFRIFRAFLLASLISVPLTLVFFLAGWTASIATLLPGSAELPWLSHAVVFASSTALLLCLFAVFHNRFQIDQFSAGAATISLSTKSATYFDEYLDEIVYFFEAVKRDIVIFEDIDRFDDAHIFETLRSLNSILNGAHQLRGRRIRFVYAIKDSIFDELGTRAAKEEMSDEASDAESGSQEERLDAAEAEVGRANRTKFFDLVIPVVPFITHRSARDLLVQAMSQDLEHNVSDDLIDLTARYVADMRLIKNIRNEYAIFKQLIIDSGSLELTEDGLFAMVLFKSTHLSEFELIKLGRSNLDTLYREGREIVADNIKTLNTTIRSARTRRSRLSISANDATKLGDLFAAHMEVTLRHFNIPSSQVQSRIMDGVEVDDAMLHSSQFWEKYAAVDGSVDLNYFHPNYGRYETMSFKRADIEQAIHRPISSAEWVREAQNRFDADISRAVADRDFLSHADMSDLMAREEFKLQVGEQSFSFASRAKTHLDSELALRLLETGHIDRNFTLYTSTFHADRVSAKATNFILKNVDPNTIDMHFELSPEDVDAVLRERGRSFLTEKSVYNVSVLDHLVQSDSEGLDTIVGRLLTEGQDEQEFLLTYLDVGSFGSELIAALAPKWSSVFNFLAANSGLDASQLQLLMNTALRAISSDVGYAADDVLGEYLVNNYRDLDVFVSETTSDATAAQVANLLRDAAVKLPSLDGLGLAMRAAVVSTGSYLITEENLLLALDNPQHSLSLNDIRSSNQSVYSTVLSNVSGYIDALGDDRLIVTAPADFANILEDIPELDEDVLPTIVERSTPQCRVEKLSDIASITWSALAKFGRFPVTFDNVHAYINEIGLDNHLSRMLEAAGKIDTPEEADEQAKSEIGLTILRAQQRINSAKARAELLGSLGIKEYIDASLIPRESGDLVGWLLANDIVKSDAATFTAVDSDDIDGLAFAISQASSFPNFMTTTEVSPSNVAQLLGHSLISEPTRDAILARLAEFTVGTSRADLNAIARYAVQTGKSMTFQDVARLASEHVDSPLVLTLLQRHLDEVEVDELATVLVNLGGEYEKLSAANGKHPRIPNTEANRMLVERLQQLGLTSTVSVVDDDIKVNMRQA